MKSYSYYWQIIADLGLSAKFANIATTNVTNFGVSSTTQITTYDSKTAPGSGDVCNILSANTENPG